jgi:hypothetical protein
MEVLRIPGTDETPAVVLDPVENIFEFSGKSLPEDVTSFYSPVLDWLDAYDKKPLAKTVVDFKLSYFNTASSKLILDILFKLESIHQSGSEVLIRWYYESEDEDMKEAGKEYGDLLEVPFALETL